MMHRLRTGIMTACLALAGTVPLAACSTASWHLVITQASDVATGQDHKGHVAPGAFAGITLTVRNTGAGPARGIRVTDVLPDGFHYYELTTIGGNAIRTATEDPGQQGDPEWGTWTIPQETSGKDSSLVLSFVVQAAIKPGEYSNKVKLASSTLGVVDAGDPVVIVVEPRPSLTVITGATAPKASTANPVTYVVSVSNAGSAVARHVAVSITLPPGFLFLSTTDIQGNSARIESVDPPAGSLLPVWGSWDIPSMAGTAPGVLRIIFQAQILPGVQPGLYSLTTAITGANDIPAQTIGDSAPVAVGKSTTIPITMRVAPTAPYAAQNGTVGYVITVENDSVDAAQAVTITDTLPPGFVYQATNSISINGKGVGSRLQPLPGAGTPQWGPFVVPAGGFSGATLVITFTAKIAPDAALGPHPNVVSGSSSNSQITGGADQSPVVVIAG